MSKYVTVLGIAAAIVLVDQLTKWWVHSAFELYESRPVIEGFFHLTYLRNRGGAFSILANQPTAIRIPFFVIVSSIALGVLFYFLRSVAPTQRVLLLSLSAILGGALGNLIDRVLAGEVIDFLDVHWRGYHWPAFNVADSCITVGTITLLVHSFIHGDPTAQRSASEPRGLKAEGGAKG